MQLSLGSSAGVIEIRASNAVVIWSRKSDCGEFECKIDATEAIEAADNIEDLVDNKKTGGFGLPILDSSGFISIDIMTSATKIIEPTSRGAILDLDLQQTKRLANGLRKAGASVFADN